MQTIKEARKYQYDYHSEKFPYLNDWKRNPYSFLKARFYMETSAVLVYFLLKTKIKPNTVTIIYGLAGIATGILLTIQNNYTICIALVIAFTKGILDWSDGHLARITGQTSLTGYILDGYGAVLNSFGFLIGLGLYVAGRADSLLFYYLLPLLLFFKGAELLLYSKIAMFTEISSKNNISICFQDNDSQGKYQDNINIIGLEISYSRYKNIFKGVFDDRARSVDFVCLIILLEIFFPINISWVIFLLIVARYFILFTTSFYIVGKGGWAENEMTNKLIKLHELFQKK